MGKRGFLYGVIPPMKKQFGFIKKLNYSKDLEDIYHAGDAGQYFAMFRFGRRFPSVAFSMDMDTSGKKAKNAGKDM